MRIIVRGGVWKNTEDEILKAAVMKYGKNQWSRISSLLDGRKSAKQCKARWYDRLDPSIKKIEWTREEDEKLLHLAKLIPAQWSTVAPIVGRTPSQCLERYEKLLDAACSKDENFDDLRKLRPGEIDPNPESRPARPDPVDMDEAEKEMLAEAGARVANTRGKKAKRKAREKTIEISRMLASLQKKRELVAAGIGYRQRRKRRGIDYNAEIPFEKKPLPGFYDVSNEDRPVEQPKFPTTIDELEGEKRMDREARLRKQDIGRNKIAERKDTPSAILQANKSNDPLKTAVRRSKLMLPPPQISEIELEEIARMGDLLAEESDELAEGSGATRAFLANYGQTPHRRMTPLRTPQRTPAAGKGDAIVMEAENLARLRESQTPLLGGQNPELHPSDFSGVTPKRRREILTPNPMLPPPAATPGMTPLKDGYSFGATPLRDGLHINEDIGKLELPRQADLRKKLRSCLSSLPQPKNEYQIVLQPLPEDSEEPEDKIEEDMSEARQEALLKKRSEVLQRELPRPSTASLELIKNSLIIRAPADEDKSSFVPSTPIEQADEMIRRELLSLLEHDNSKYPLDEKEKKKGVKRDAKGEAKCLAPEIDDCDKHELEEADCLIREESQSLRNSSAEAHTTCSNDDIMYSEVAALRSAFENAKRRMEADSEKAKRLEKKIEVVTNGYEMRAVKLLAQIEATVKQLDTAQIELECFQALQGQEQLAASRRTSCMLEQVQKQKELEQTLQRRYGDLLC